MTDDIPLTITVRYSCGRCGITRRAVEVEARDPERTDVVDYVERIIGEAVGEDHARTSPDCDSQTMSELLIPNPKGADYVGQPVKQ